MIMPANVRVPTSRQNFSSRNYSMGHRHGFQVRSSLSLIGPD
ncbi:hypothetical protein [Subtercola boreus]|nr:hypothetical protein [Subtercola boreus]